MPNQFPLLTLTLSRSDVWSAAVMVIVVQSPVELFRMMLYLKWVPNKLLPVRSAI
jgi:hypothetical protein